MRISDWSSDVCSSDLAEGAFWSGAVAIAHRPSSRGAAAQRRIIAPRFTSLEAGRNDALHNEIDALTCRPKQGAGRASDRTQGPSMLYHAFDMQKSWLAGASALATAGAQAMQHPTNPLGYFGARPLFASALEVFAPAAAPRGKPRSEERRVGKEGGRSCSSRWSPYH